MYIYFACGGCGGGGLSQSLFTIHIHTFLLNVVADSTSIWHNILLNSVDMFYTVYIIPKRILCQFIIICGNTLNVREVINCALILDGR